jgi:hypothetical protein
MGFFNGLYEFAADITALSGDSEFEVYGNEESGYILTYGNSLHERVKEFDSSEELISYFNSGLDIYLREDEIPIIGNIPEDAPNQLENAPAAKATRMNESYWGANVLAIGKAHYEDMWEGAGLNLSPNIAVLDLTGRDLDQDQIKQLESQIIMLEASEIDQSDLEEEYIHWLNGYATKAVAASEGADLDQDPPTEIVEILKDLEDQE